MKCMICGGEGRSLAVFVVKDKKTGERHEVHDKCTGSIDEARYEQVDVYGKII